VGDVLAKRLTFKLEKWKAVRRVICKTLGVSKFLAFLRLQRQMRIPMTLMRHWMSAKGQSRRARHWTYRQAWISASVRYELQESGERRFRFSCKIAWLSFRCRCTVKCVQPSLLPTSNSQLLLLTGLRVYLSGSIADR
jgi:hypothetical protein